MVRTYRLSAWARGSAVKSGMMRAGRAARGREGRFMDLLSSSLSPLRNVVRARDMGSRDAETIGLEEYRIRTMRQQPSVRSLPQISLVALSASTDIMVFFW